MSEPPSKRARLVAASAAGGPPRPLAAPARLVSAEEEGAGFGMANPESAFFKGISKLKARLEARQACKDAVFPVAKRLKHAIDMNLIRFFSAGEDASDGSAPVATLAHELIAALDADGAKAAGLATSSSVAGALSDAVALDALIFFVSHGHLKRQRSEESVSGLAGVSDAIYLGGLITGARHLERYAIGRATYGDRVSVAACQNFVGAFLEQLMAFDFRNGPLRRAYDGVKYTHKRLGDVMYETSLCVVQDGLGGGKGDDGGAATKRDDAKAEDPASADAASAAAASNADANSDTDPSTLLLPLAEIEQVRVRMVAFDEKRENVIKRCRDVQKLSKQSIFSLHRNQAAKARAQLAAAMAKAQSISAEFDFASTPELRSGSFQNAMEEWVEGRLFEAWLESHGNIILSPDELSAELPSPLIVTEEEYLGGLVDFTGEVGRWAVLQATYRNRAAVENALAADLTVEAALIHLGTSVPGRMGKKVGALRNNVKKLEHVLYELSLLKGTGRRTIAAEKSAPSSSSAVVAAEPAE